MTEKKVVKFSKDQIVNSKRFDRFSDFLKGNLENDKEYSVEQVSALIYKEFKEKV